MKVIANYLPQFHEIEENNEWWGKGFTEWTNTKKGRPLFRNHYQPIEPKEDNYYDLMNKETIKWQTKIAQDNSIYGFAYYHYWSNGKKLLEKPAENLLQWKDINQRFCFVWANHDWKRSWDGTSEILIKQEYGNEKNWIEHFNYLKQFFEDERYIKIDNKPVFGIYDSSKIKDMDKMIRTWNELSIQNGGNGVYIVEILRNKYSNVNLIKESNAIIISEPSFALENMSFFYRALTKVELKLHKLYNKKCLRSYSYSKIVNISLKYSKKIKVDKKIFFGGFTSWDNSSRHGNRGYVIKGSTPEKFKKYLANIKELSEENGSEYVFVNAWNEWCEGMYLEPDKKFGYRYLEAVKEVVGQNDKI